jgi:ADP-ribosylglycohydrolase
MLSTKTNNLRNLVYGSLIGDAMGIQFEFYSKKLINIPFILNYNPSHFLPIKAGKWSDDGDNILMVVDTLIENKSNVFDYKLFANKLHNWVNYGNPELGDTTSVGCGNTIYSVVSDDNFLDNPFVSSQTIYEKTRTKSNGAIMKILPLSIWYDDEETMISNTILLCRVTHMDKIVIASCIAVNLLLYLAMTENNNYYDKLNRINLKCKIISKIRLINQNLKLELTESEINEVYKHITFENIEDLKLDEEFKMGYTLKTMGCVFWAFDNLILGYQKILKTIYSEGGDTDTNGCVAGGLVSSLLSMHSIPTEWIDELNHKDFIEKRFIDDNIC